MNLLKRYLYPCLASLVLLLVIMFSLMMGFNYAQAANRTVKVAYVLSPGYQEGKAGEYKTGYGYEYLQVIAGITGWEYEYVYGSFQELLSKLESGEIDLMGNLSYTPERATKIDFGHYEQGRENYYLYVNQRRSDLSSDSPYSELNGKKIGVNAASVQAKLWEQWCREHDIQCEMVPFTNSTERFNALNSGLVDGAIGGVVSASRNVTPWRSVLSFASTPFYFGVSKKRPELLAELNEAQGKILTADPYFNREVRDRYMREVSLPNTALTIQELTWLQHYKGSLQIGCLDNYLPLSDRGDDGVVRGIIPDIINAMKNEYGIQINIKAYSDYRTMLEDLRTGKLCAVGPIYGDFWNADKEHLVLTKPFMSTRMQALYKKNYVPNKDMKIGVDMSSPLQLLYVQIYFPKEQRVLFNSERETLNALENGTVDVVYNSTAYYNVAAPKNKLLNDFRQVVEKGDVNLSLAVNKQNLILASILSKGIDAVGKTAVFNSIALNSNVEREMTITDYISHHPLQTVAVGSLIISALLIIIFHLRRAIRKAKMDSMTGLLNKNAMRDLMSEHMHDGGVMFMIDIDNFKQVNDNLGHKAGDVLLNYFSDGLKKTFRSNDIIGRFGGDEFMVFMKGNNHSYELIEHKAKQVAQILQQANELLPHHEEICSASIGILEVPVGSKLTFVEAFDKVDAALYEAKRKGKNTFVLADCQE